MIPQIYSKKVTLDEFTRMCKEKGLFVAGITKRYIYLEERQQEIILPNVHATLCKDPILRTWQSSSFEGEFTLEELIKRDLKISAIKCIRAITNLGLKDSKDIVCDNWDVWRRMVLG
jgi:hypothetical protein